MLYYLQKALLFFKQEENTVRKGEIAHYEQFLAPLAEGQRAIVMALCPSSVRPFVRACVRKLFL